LRPNWFENDELTNRAFRRRPNETDGISVASSHDAAKRLLRSGWGVAALSRDAIASIEGLSIVFDNENHGYIKGVPVYAENPSDVDYDRALEIADRLLELARNRVVHDPWKRD
jgi:hypothetical protein